MQPPLKTYMKTTKPKLIKVATSASPEDIREAEITAVMNALYRCASDSGTHWAGSWAVTRTEKGFLVNTSDDQPGTGYRIGEDEDGHTIWGDPAIYRFFAVTDVQGGWKLLVGTSIEDFRDEANREVEDRARRKESRESYQHEERNNGDD